MIESKAKVQAYDAREFYNEKLRPLLDQVVRLCDEEKLPFIVIAQTSHDGSVPVMTVCSKLYGEERADLFMARMLGLISNPDQANVFFAYLAKNIAKELEESRKNRDYKGDFQKLLESIHEAARKLKEEKEKK